MAARPWCAGRRQVTRPDDRNRKAPGHAISPTEQPRLSSHLAAQSDPNAPDPRGEPVRRWVNPGNSPKTYIAPPQWLTRATR